MNKLLFRKLSLDIIYFFLTASLSITLIVWVIQAVNFLDIVSEDGYSLKVYFAYTLCLQVLLIQVGHFIHPIRHQRIPVLYL